jgi:hypothetical protein
LNRRALRAARRIALEIVGAQSTLWPDSLDVMGWKIDGRGFHRAVAISGGGRRLAAAGATGSSSATGSGSGTSTRS